MLFCSRYSCFKCSLVVKLTCFRPQLCLVQQACPLLELIFLFRDLRLGFSSSSCCLLVPGMSLFCEEPGSAIVPKYFTLNTNWKTDTVVENLLGCLQVTPVETTWQAKRTHQFSNFFTSVFVMFLWDNGGQVPWCIVIAYTWFKVRYFTSKKEPKLYRVNTL